MNKRLRGNIDEMVSNYSREATDASYGTSASDYISEERVAIQLRSEFDKIPKVGNRKKLAIASTAYTSRAGGYSWVGVKLQLSPEAGPVEVIAKIKLNPDSSANQGKSLATFANGLVDLIQKDFNDSKKISESILKSEWHGGAVDSLNLNGQSILKPMANDTIKATPTATPRPGRKELSDKILSESTGIVDFKARDINLNAGIKGTIIEIGEEAPVVTNWILSSPFSGTIYQARYITDAAKIKANNLNQIRDLLNENYRKVIIPEESNFLKKFSYIKKVDHYQGKKFLTMAIKGGQNEKNTVIFKVEVPPNADEEDLGKIGINFLYAFNKYSADPKKFMNSLIDGVSIPKLNLKDFKIQGEDFEPLRKFLSHQK